ncbi:uncharacterized protein ACRADG_010606 isoform 2-T2 [Cochliomyia hominivorax]
MFTSSFIMPNDLSDLCRVCLQLPEESQYLDLTTIYDEEDNLTYGECFFICTQIDLNDGEGVPHQLCKTCGLELQMSYDFHKKIEESKRVIAQCQKQIQEQKATYNANDLLVSGVESNKETSPLKEEENGITHLINNNKYIISEEEMELESGPSSSASHQEQQDVMQHINEQTYENTGEINEEATNEIDIVNKMNSNDLNVGKEDHKSSLEEVNFVTTEQEEHLEVDDYQNLEALEEEATKTKRTIKEEFPHNDPQQQIETNQRREKSPTNQNTQHRTSPSIEIENMLQIKMELPTEYNSDNELLELNKTSSSHDDHNHINEIQVEKETISENVLTVIPTLNLKFKTAIFQCEFCDHRLPTKNALYKHRVRKHKNQKPFNRKFLKSLLNCNLCGKTFNDLPSLKQHKHNEHWLYACEYCGHKVPTRNALSQHRLRKHRDPEKTKKKILQLKCSQCSECFRTRETLNLHKTQQHERTILVKLESRTEVKREDSYSDQLVSKRNVLTKHRNKKLYKCEDCDHKVPTKNALSQHRRRKHRNKTGNGAFKCEECDYRLPTKNALSKHRVRKHRNKKENEQKHSSLETEET